MRARIGEGVTAFTRIEDGARSVAVGDIVKLAVRPALMGVVQHFIVHQARALTPALHPGKQALCWHGRHSQARCAASAHGGCFPFSLCVRRAQH